jgi:hypothetical protein
MPSRVATITCALALLVAVGASAQSVTVVEERGRLLRLDPQASVVVLEDGRMFRVAPGTVILVDNRPVEIGTLQPGSSVVIRAGEPVAYREGRYVTVAAPSALPAQAQIGGVRQTLYGQVTDIDKNGETKIKTPKGSFEILLSPDAARTVKKGDTVTLDVTITPPGAAPPVTR